MFRATPVSIQLHSQIRARLITAGCAVLLARMTYMPSCTHRSPARFQRGAAIQMTAPSDRWPATPGWLGEVANVRFGAVEFAELVLA